MIYNTVKTQNVQKIKCSLLNSMFIQNSELHSSQIQACRTYSHGRTHTQQGPQHMGVVWWGNIKQRLDRLGCKWIAGLSTRVHLPLCPLQYKIWLYHYTLGSPSPTLGTKSVTNTFLYLPQVHWGSNQTLIWSLLALGLEMGISYATCNYTNTNTWGLSMKQRGTTGWH